MPSDGNKPTGFDDQVLAAKPGYWLHCIPMYDDDHQEFESYSSSVIARRLTNNGFVPMPLDKSHGLLWDSAIELPDGECIDDSSDVYVDFESWLTRARAAWEQSRAEEKEFAA